MAAADVAAVEKKLLAGLAGIPLLMIFMAIFLPWYGLALSVLWQWFVVPLGVPAITWAHGAGLVLLLSLTKGRLEKTQPPGAMQWTMYVVWPAIAMAIGFILKSI